MGNVYSCVFHGRTWGDHGSCSDCDAEIMRECLALYEFNQRRHDDATWRGGFTLTPLQLAAARTAWSAQLRAKQAETRAKERMEVVCERDEDGE